MKRSREPKSGRSRSVDSGPKSPEKCLGRHFLHLLAQAQKAAESVPRQFRSNTLVHNSDLPSNLLLYRQTLYIALQQVNHAFDGVPLNPGQRSIELLSAYAKKQPDIRDWCFSVHQLDDLLPKWNGLIFNPPKWLIALQSISEWEENFKKYVIEFWEEIICKVLNIGITGLRAFMAQHRGLMFLARLPHEEFCGLMSATMRWKSGLYPDVGFSFKPETYHLTFLCERYKWNWEAIATACRKSVLLNTFEPIDPRAFFPGAEYVSTPYYGGVYALARNPPASPIAKSSPHRCALHDRVKIITNMTGNSGCHEIMCSGDSEDPSETDDSEYQSMGDSSDEAYFCGMDDSQLEHFFYHGKSP